jgi:hypothetical protein
MQAIKFETSYQSLTGSERSFVDRFVEEVDVRASHERRPITEMLETYQGDPEPMLMRSNVRNAIHERVHEISRSRAISTDRLVQELSSIAFSNIGDLFDIDKLTDEVVYDFTKLTPTQWAAIKSIRIETVGVKRQFKVEMHSKIEALGYLVRLLEAADSESPLKRAMRSKVTQIEADTPIEVAAELYAEALNAG